MKENPSIPTWDNFINRLCRESEPWLLERRNRLRPAEILDQDIQQISTGPALVEDADDLAVFWPQDAFPLENPRSAAILKLSDGRSYEIRGAWRYRPDEAGCVQLSVCRIEPCQMAATPTPQTEAHAIVTKGEIRIARFDSKDIGGRIYLVLDRGRVPDISPTRFSPPPDSLLAVSGSGVAYHYVGRDPIDLRPYLELPPGRRGFVIVDELD